MSTKNDRRRPRSATPAALWAVLTLVALELLLMAFSVTMWQLGNDAMAATAGAGAMALAIDIARRLLAVLPSTPHLPASSRESPPATTEPLRSTPDRDPPGEGSNDDNLAVR